MSGDVGEPGATGVVRRTGRAVGAAVADAGGRALFAATTLGYAVVYLAAVGDLGGGGGRVGVTTVRTPLVRALEGEAVALVELGPVEYLFTPAAAAVAVTLGALVGANLAVSYLAWRRPAACGVTPATGVAAGLPALLSGTVCCGPAVLVVLGVQASGLLLSAFAWLRPTAVVLLVVSLLWAGSRLAPPAGTTASGS